MTDTAASQEGSNATPCPLCGSRAARELLGYREHPSMRDGLARMFRYRVVQCAECELGRLDPMPDIPTVAGFYSASYSCYQPHDPLGSASRSRKHDVAARRFTAGRRLHTRLGRLASKGIEWATGKTISYSLGVPLGLPKDARILELGFGNGEWLMLMHARGYRNLAGYDIGENAAHSEPLRALGIDITGGDFLANDYGVGSWDCIRMEHVLEHVHDPVATLRKCRTMLKQTGLLVMTLPCVDSLSTQISLECSPNGRELPLHLYHHTRRSLLCLLDEAGFQQRRVRVFGDAVSLLATVRGRLGVEPGRALDVVAKAGSPAYGALTRLFQRGELVTVVAGDLSRVPE